MAKLHAGLYGVAPVVGHGCRYIVILPERNEAYRKAWQALNEQFGIRPAGTGEFMTTSGGGVTK